MMQPGLWSGIKAEIAIWRVGILPGLAVIGLVTFTRLFGSLESLEWMALDSFLRWRSEEPIDARILLVEINQGDNYSLTSTISDSGFVGLLEKLQVYQPKVIGLNIDRNLLINSPEDDLVKLFQKYRNLIATENILPAQIHSHLDLPPEQIAFADQILDSDGKARRSLLAINTSNGYKLSFAMRLARIYLAQENISLESSQLGKTKLPRFLPNSGGYIRADASGFQVLINFRSGTRRFRTLSGEDIKNGKFNPEWIRDRIVIIGITNTHSQDFIPTSAITSIKSAPKQVNTLEIQAHAISQIISAVLDGRPLINTWNDGWEYTWIFVWGFLGIVIARFTKSPLVNFLVVGITITSLLVISYLLLIWGWWVPVIPAILVLTINGMELIALYQYDQALRLGMKTRQDVIESTFETIHNGPLQSLAQVLKLIRCENTNTQELLPKIEKELEKLNHELRGIYEFLQQEYPSQDIKLYLGNNLVLSLQDPLHEVLYQVYSYTLDREFPCFKTIKVAIRSFEPIDEKSLSMEQKRGICRFLEEALCNVGKHATGVTKLQVTCSLIAGWYTLKIIDNGLGVNSSKKGRGTQQFINLARQLRGKFQRSPQIPQGTICELSWPVSQFWR
ncbi:possible Sensor with Chase2 domain [Trichormus variabilis ATCC 29413]|uniref:Possible Sensor with Chase2 domain n=2 Tax=Anabaena variabilis TaxID=264691 RepID=Q3MAG7_TRIV2|nr:possible Sensor with Chase2 domain [Trichormus variabilis ATCC 29413]